VGTLYNDKEWLRLLHTYPTLFGKFKSEATSPKFFLSSNGQESPEDELKALINQVGDESISEEDHPVCRFPARIDWLRRHYPKIKIANITCTRLNEFKKRVSAKSASVVFSSYYLNNPSSSFGHTFVRIGKNEEILDNGKHNLELLDTGINYGAATGEAGPLLYFFGGLNGYFSGTFTAVPYYYKVREYNDFETRDLWTYHLNLSKTEIEQLINHVWELGHNTFDYYFLSKNCSYHVLTILEAIRPDLNLLDKIPKLYTIPSETLKVLVSAGLVKKITFRPSARTSFQKSASSLSASERKIVKQLARGEDIDLENFATSNKAKILDSAIGLVDYKYAKEVLKKEEAAQGFKRPLLLRRASIPVNSEDEEYSSLERNPPHTGHASNRLLISTGHTSENIVSKNFLEIDWRFAAQDLLDNDDTYPSFNKLEIGRLAFRYNLKNKILFKEFTLLDSYSLGTWNEFIFSPAWNVRAGGWLSEKGLNKYQTAGFQGGYGAGKETLGYTLFLVPHLEGSYVYQKLNRFKFAYGFDLGLASRLMQDLKFVSILEWRDKKWDEKKWKNEIRWANRVYGVGLAWTSSIEQKTDEFSLKVLQYF
jgi:hypothetical protein